MPREFVLVSTEPVSLSAVRDAAAAVDPGLVPRTLFGGWAVQLLDTDDAAVITIEVSRLLQDVADAERLVGTLPSAGPLWWTEATSPWGPTGEPGVDLARALGGVIGARLVVEEGR